LKVQKKPENVVILGGGPAGLAAGWKMSEKGVKVKVIEGESQIGGQCKTIAHNEFLFDLGGHRFISNDKEVLDEIRALMGDDLLIRPRKSIVKLRGKDFNYPLEPLNLVKSLSPLVTGKCFLDYLFHAAKSKLFPREDISLEDWVVHRFGRSLYELYFGHYSEKLWGVSPKEISSEWAAQRITLLNLGDVMLRLLKLRKSDVKTYVKEFYYPKKGIGQICDRMGDEIEKNGGEIVLNAQVNGIETEGDLIKRIKYSSDGAEHAAEAEHYVNTIPMPEFIRICNPSAKPAALEAIKPMHHRGIRFLNLIIDAPQVSENTWIYIPEQKKFFFRIQETRNWSPTLVPEGKTGIILEISCDENDEIWNMPEEEVLERCLDDMDEIRMPVREKVAEHFSSYLAEAYPIYFIGYAERRDEAYRYLAKFINLTPCGRQGLYRYNNMDHSIKMGFLAARHLTEGTDRAEIFKIASESRSFEPLLNTIYRTDGKTELNNL
jgi:protoporphyrinogen oxidase